MPTLSAIAIFVYEIRTDVPYALGTTMLISFGLIGSLPRARDDFGWTLFAAGVLTAAFTSWRVLNHLAVQYGTASAAYRAEFMLALCTFAFLTACALELRDCTPPSSTGLTNSSPLS